MLRIVRLGILAALITAPHVAFAEDSAVRYCVDVSIPRQATEARNGRWIELTSEQWQFLRGIYAMNPETPPGLPYGDKAALARVDGNSSGLVFFIDGDKACTPMRAPPQLLALMEEVATGDIVHQGACCRLSSATGSHIPSICDTPVVMSLSKTANSASSAPADSQSCGSLSELSQWVWREHQPGRGASRENCATTTQNNGQRPVIEAVYTVARSPLFSQLSDQDVARLNARCLWRKVKAGEFFLDQTTDGYALSVVTAGRVRAVRMINGREVILRDINQGEYFGELSATDDSLGPAQMVAITDAVVARLPSREFREAIYRHQSVCDHVLNDLSERIRALNDRFSEQVFLGARERLCVELLRLSRRTAKDRIAISPPPSHFEFAGRIGGCRETVTKLLSAFERDGLISRSRRAIALTDVPRLKAMANG